MPPTATTQRGKPVLKWGRVTEYCESVVYGYVVNDRTKTYVTTLMFTTTVKLELLMHMFAYEFGN